MNATPPEANTEYSRGPGPSRGRLGGRFRPPGRAAPDPLARLRGVIFLTGLLGALLLFVAGFTTLFTVHAEGVTDPIKTVSTGSHDPGLFPVAVLAAILAWAVWRAGSRPALLGIGLMGVVALVLVLTRDLPDVGANGVIRSDVLRLASTTAGPGPFLETAGAALLLITCVCGFLLLPAPAPARPRGRSGDDPNRRSDSAAREGRGGQSERPAPDRGDGRPKPPAPDREDHRPEPPEPDRDHLF